MPKSEQNDKQKLPDAVDLLASDNYLVVNKTLADKYGLNEAVVLAELASEARYWKKSGKMEDGWFFSTNENLVERLPFSEQTIRRAVKSLEDQGLLETRVFGMPATKHYRLQFYQNGSSGSTKLQFYQIGSSSSAKLEELVLPNWQTKNKENNKEKNTQKGADAPTDVKKTTKEKDEKADYGNSKVNEFLKEWKEETGDDFTKDKRERRATWNLLQKNSSEAIEALLRAVGDARRHPDRFTPQIASPSDLVGKYNKLGKLRMWVVRNQTPEQPIPGYLADNPLPPEDNLSDEEREKVQEMFRQARASGKHKWMKPKESE